MSLCSIRALVALCRFAPYALWSRYVALLHTRSWRGYVLTGVARIRRAWPLPLLPLPIGAGELNPCAIRESGRLAVVMAPCALMDWR